MCPHDRLFCPNWHRLVIGLVIGLKPWNFLEPKGRPKGIGKGTACISNGVLFFGWLQRTPNYRLSLLITAPLLRHPFRGAASKGSDPSHEN